jgi:hypothetical protein
VIGIDIPSGEQSAATERYAGWRTHRWSRCWDWLSPSGCMTGFRSSIFAKTQPRFAVAMGGTLLAFALVSTAAR